MLELVDYYGGTLLIIALASLEVIGLNWIYGTSRLTRDFNFMLQTELSRYWRFCWGVICPLLLPLLFFYAILTQAGMPDALPTTQVFGWIIALVGILVVPLHFVLSITKDEEGDFLPRVISVLKSGQLCKKVREIFKPNSSWGPSSLENRGAWEEYSESVGLYQWLPQYFYSKLKLKEASSQAVP